MRITICRRSQVVGGAGLALPGGSGDNDACAAHTLSTLCAVTDVDHDIGVLQIVEYLAGALGGEDSLYRIDLFCELRRMAV
jgi:hypothetical protein